MYEFLILVIVDYILFNYKKQLSDVHGRKGLETICLAL